MHLHEPYWYIGWGIAYALGFICGVALLCFLICLADDVSKWVGNRIKGWMKDRERATQGSPQVKKCPLCHHPMVGGVRMKYVDGLPVSIRGIWECKRRSCRPGRRSK